MFIFWFCAFLITYTYFLYPLVLILLSCFIKRKVKKSDIEPGVSVVITAYNEENVIAAKIEELLGADYPKEKLQIIVASDASTDRTDDIVLSFKDKGIVLSRQNKRLGKTAAQNKAVRLAEGEIIVFFDATTIFHKDIIRKLVRNFADRKVGCAGAELIYVNDNHTPLGRARRLYWAYEKFLRRKESSLNSLLGVSGCCYAVRKKIYKQMDPRLISDFIIAWFVYERGYRAVFEEEAKVYERIVETEYEEVKMRTRVTSRSFVALKMMRRFFNPFKFGFFSFQIFSHKLLRYAVPLFILILLISNIFLIGTSPYRFFFYGELFFLILGALSLFMKEKSIFYPFFYFFIGNYSILKGMFKLGGSRKYEVWKPLRERKIN